ncbi:MAG: glycosyltransferase [Croceitalea sp.]|nr:TIGR04283 family arsenosugar biosynthesis glycosyltransferase [Croceitalea sp.]NNC35663.1 glycosyltransferase [Croceitalea sp.]NNM17203.1 glycosyltransferase [Croceitalea sp.]
MISVVIPAHNERQNLLRLLPRLLQLAKGHSIEIIVCYSKSNSQFLTEREASPPVTAIHCSNNGRALQMNEGSIRAEGDILVFLHADVIPPKGFFEDITATLANGHEAGFFSYQFDKQNFWLGLNASFTKRDGLFTGGGDQCLFIKRAAFEQLGRFDEKQVIMEDFEFFKRMKSKKVPYTIVDNPLLVSARKYENNSYLRINLTNLILVILFKMGLAPLRLQKIHNSLIRLPYQNNS